MLLLAEACPAISKTGIRNGTNWTYIFTNQLADKLKLLTEGLLTHKQLGDFTDILKRQLRLIVTAYEHAQKPPADINIR